MNDSEGPVELRFWYGLAWGIPLSVLGWLLFILLLRHVGG